MVYRPSVIRWTNGVRNYQRDLSSIVETFTADGLKVGQSCFWEQGTGSFVSCTNCRRPSWERGPVKILSKRWLYGK